MDKQLTVDDIKNAKDIYLYDQGILYVVDEIDEAYGFCENGDSWFHKENFWDYFDSSLMLSYFNVLSKDQAISLYEEWTKKRSH